MNEPKTYFEVKNSLRLIQSAFERWVPRELAGDWETLAALQTSVIRRFGRPAVGVSVVLRSTKYFLPGHRFVVLLGTRSGSHGAGLLALPGGHQDYTEDEQGLRINANSIRKTAEIEPFEETGCVVKIIGDIRLAEEPFEAEPGKWYQDVFCLAETDDDPRICEPDKLAMVGCADASCVCAKVGAPESDGWHWYDPTRLPDKPIFGPTVEAIKSFLKELNPKKHFRLYELIVDNKRQFHKLPGSASAIWDNGYSQVTEGTWIIENGEPRKWTAQDRIDLQEAADSYSGSK